MRLNTFNFVANSAVVAFFLFADPAIAYPDPEHKCDLPRALYKEVLKRVDGGRRVEYDYKSTYRKYMEAGLSNIAITGYGRLDGDLLTGMDGSDSWLIDALTYIPSKTAGEMTCEVVIDYHGDLSGKMQGRISFAQRSEAGNLKITDIFYGEKSNMSSLRDLLRSCRILSPFDFHWMYRNGIHLTLPRYEAVAGCEGYCSASIKLSSFAKARISGRRGRWEIYRALADGRHMSKTNCIVR